MATTILYEKKSTYGGPYCFYTVQYTEKSRTATSVKLGITVLAKLQYPASYNGYKLTGVLTVAGTAYSIPLKGTETWSGTAVHTITKDITVSASAGTTSLSAKFAVTNPSTTSSVLSTTACSNISISRYYTEASITIANGTIGEKIRIDMTGKYPSTATCDITYTFGSKKGTVVSGTTASYVMWDTSKIRVDLLEQIPDAEFGTCNFNCVTKVSGSSIGSDTGKCTLYSAENVTIKSVTVTPVNNNQFLKGKNIFVAGYSQAAVTVAASPGTGSSMKSYSITGIGSGGSSASWQSPVINDHGKKTITVKVTDKRGTSATTTREITVLKYEKPKVTLMVERGYLNNGQWVADSSGSRLRVYGKVTVTLDGNSANLVMTLDGQSVELTEPIASTGEYQYISAGDVPSDVLHEVKVYATDALGERSTDVVFRVPTEVVNMSMRPGNKGVTLGGHPVEDGFTCRFPAKLYGGIHVDSENSGFKEAFTALYDKQGGIVSLGRLLLDFAHPVGSYYWSSSSVNPGTLFGGTWTRITGRFVLAASDDYSVGSTGGSATVTLTKAQMPAHTHTVSATAEAAGSHRHNIGCDYDGAGGSIYATIHKSTSSSPGYWAGRTTSNGSHTHSVSGTAASAGSGSAHSNMPPYVTAYCWRRTA